MVRNKSIGNTIFRTLAYIFLVFLSVLSIYPFLVMFFNATRSTIEIQQQALPFWFSNNIGDNIAIINRIGNFSALVGFRNSLIVATATTALSVYFSSMTAFGLTAYDWKLRRPFFAFIMAVMMMPAMVVIVGFYRIIWDLGFTNSFLPLILPGIAAPAVVFFMRQYLLSTLSIDIVNSARIDGAGEFRIFNQIILPMMKPALATQAIFVFVASWNNLFLPSIIINRVDMFTMPMMVQTLTDNLHRQELGVIYLGLSMSLIPLFIFYFILSKYIIAGVQLGGVKE